MSTFALPALRKRSLALVISLVLAGLATVALVSYVRGVENRATYASTPVSVYVAKADIPVNTSVADALARGLIGREMIPRSLVIPGAITSLAALEGRFAATTILEGEQIATARFVATSASSGTVLPIPAGKQALAVSVTVPHGVAGFVQPGNHVSLIGHFELVGKTWESKGLNNQKATQYIVQNVLVLAVNREISSPTGTASAASKEGKDAEASAQATDSVLLTLALSPSDAEKVTYLAFGGDNIWFTLVPDGQKPVKTSGRTPLNITAR